MRTVIQVSFEVLFLLPLVAQEFNSLSMYLSIVCDLIPPRPHAEVASIIIHHFDISQAPFCLV